MSPRPNHTHDPNARSWVVTANLAGSDFPIQNLPCGAFVNGEDGCATLGVAIGDQVLDLRAAIGRGLLDGLDEVTREACCEERWNSMMGLGAARWSAVRHAVFALLAEGAARQDETQRCLLAQREVRMVLPAEIGDYTDFYASLHHATNVGALFRPENPLLPNYKWVPIGYHGRASSIVVSDAEVRRPHGQLKPPDAKEPRFAPSKRLDYELEVGAFVGVGNERGEAVPIAQAAGRLFGLCLVNDWSARDVQAWEYQPLGPFLAKNFATTISPWIVTTEALAPYRVAAVARAEGDPQPLEYLRDAEDAACGSFDVTVEAWLRTAQMRQAERDFQRLSRGNLREMYWSFAQMLAHHSSNGCNLRPGDLLGSGTISGAGKDSAGCLLELTRGGQTPIELADGSRRCFLEDGDEVVLRAYCERAGAARVGFGECRGVVLPAR